MIGRALDTRDVVTIVVAAALVVGAVVPPVAATPDAPLTEPSREVSGQIDGPDDGPNATFTDAPLGASVGERISVSAVFVPNATYEFDWGDGETTTGTASVASHRYDSTGAYTVTLTVTDGAGRTETATRTVRIDNATDRRVIDVDDSRPGRVDPGDPREDGRRYEPVSFAGTAGAVVAVATDTDAPTRLSVRRTDGGRDRVVRERRSATRNPAIRRLELPSDGTYTVRVVAERGDPSVDYELAVTELAASAGNDSAADTADPGRLAPETTVDGTIGRDDLRSVEGATSVEATSFEGSAGERVRLSFADPSSSPGAAVVSGPDLPPTRVESGDAFDLPGNGTYSVTVRARDTPASYALTLSTVTREERRLVVDADGRVGNYTTIGSALDAATSGDTIEVRPGTYRERVQLPDEELRLVAPDGATLAGNGSGVGVTLPRSSGPDFTQIVDGVTIRGHGTGIEQAGLIEEFDGLRLRNVTVRNNTETGIAMPVGDWSIRNATVTNNSGTGIETFSGDWTIRNATVRNNAGEGIDAFGSDGDWTVRNVEVVGNGINGIRATDASGDWIVVNARIAGNAGGDGFGSDSAGGIKAIGAAGAWRVEDTVVRDNDGFGLLARRTSGNWTLANAVVERNAGSGIDAQRSDAAWTVTNVTVDGSGGAGVDALESTGAWTVVASRLIDNGDSGIEARSSEGGWRVVDTTVAEHPGAGINAPENEGDWRVVRSTVANNSAGGIYADGGEGNWTVAATSITDSEVGIDAADSTGEWRVVGSRIARNDDEFAIIRASETTGDWTIAGTVVTDNDGTGISTAFSEGDWTIRRSIVGGNIGGVTAIESTGDWTIERTVIRDNGIRSESSAQDGVDAGSASGEWTIRESVIVDGGVDARGAAPQGDARRNWWGQVSGPASAQCRGNVDCSRWLGSAIDVDPSSATPNATFTVGGERSVGEPLRFDGSNTAAVSRIISWQLEFGDGTVVTSDRFRPDPPVATHRYGSPGTYNVTLTVTDDRGRTDSVTRTVRIRASGVAGPVSFARSPANATAGQSITFDATGSAINESVARYEWRFGDGTTATGPVVDHAYEDEGEYDVRLIAVLENGTVEEVSRVVAIEGQTYYVNDPDTSDDVEVVGGAPEFDAVRDAVETATDGDRVVVGPGEYELDRPLPVDVDITLVAPEPVAVLKPGESGNLLGIRIEGDVSPEIAGFKIVDFQTGVEAGAAAGDWSIRNASLGGPELQTGIDASVATGDWTVEGVTVLPGASASAGIVASGGVGEWEVDSARIAVNDVGIDVQGGVDAKQVGWRISKTVIRRADTPSPGDLAATGVDAVGTASDWLVEDTTVRGMRGVDATGASGNWSLANVTVADGGGPAVNASGTAGDWSASNLTLSNQSVGIDATGTTGEWEISRSNVTANGVGVRAFDAAVPGDARRNWWGQPGGPTPAQCRGAVRCGNPLGEPPTGDATGFEVRAVNGSLARPAAGVSVFAFAATPDRPPRSRNESAQAARLAGAERYVGPQLADAVASATTGPEGVVRLTGLADRRSGEAVDYCYLAVPPADSPRDVRFDCVIVERGSVTETTTRFTDDTLTSTPGGRPVAPVVRWTAASATAPTGESRALLAADGRVYVVGAETVEAFDVTTGDRLWTTTRTAAGFAAAAFADDRLHVIGRDRLYAFAPDSGDQRWRVNVTDGAGTATASNLVAANGSVYATAAVDDRLYVTAVDGDGDVRWRTETSSRGDLSGPPDAAGGRVYVATSTRLAAVDAADGTVAWETRTPVDAVAPAVSNGTVFLSSNAGEGGRVVAYDAADGTERDAYVIGTPSASGVRFGGPPAVTDGRVLVADAGRPGTREPVNVTAIDPDTGATEWRTAVRDRVRRTPVVADGAAYVATAGRIPVDRNGRLYGLDAATGDVRWTYDGSGTLAPVRAPLAVADGAVHLVDGNGTVSAIEPPTPPTREASVTAVDGASRVTVPGADAGEVATATVDREIGSDGARLTDVSVEFARPTTDTTFTVEPIAERPAALPALDSGSDPSIEPAFLQIEDSRVDDDAIGSATFVIDLPVETVNDRDAVTVFRYHDGSWRSIETDLIAASVDDGDDVLRYEVTTPGFSVFAVDPGVEATSDGSDTGDDPGGSSGADGTDDGGTDGSDGADGDGNGVVSSDDADTPREDADTPRDDTPREDAPREDADTPRNGVPDTPADSEAAVREPAGLGPVAVGGLGALVVAVLVVVLLRRRGA
jgi:pectinesterase